MMLRHPYKHKRHVMCNGMGIVGLDFPRLFFISRETGILKKSREFPGNPEISKRLEMNQIMCTFDYLFSYLFI